MNARLPSGMKWKAGSISINRQDWISHAKLTRLPIRLKRSNSAGSPVVRLAFRVPARHARPVPVAVRSTPAAIAALPRAPGVYRFRDARGRVLYLGRATELRARVRSYWGDLRGRAHLAAMVRGVARIEAVPCDSVHEASWLERNLLEESLPRWNRTRGGQEVPGYLRLDPRPGRPGLTFLHTAEPVAGTRLFGPYLGGLQVRRAMAGLHRVLPVAYTAGRLAGAEQEMARKLGLPPEAGREQRRVELVAALTWVLEREPTAVATIVDALAATRDRAAGALAFELAGRVQAEIEAIEWISQPQRVTVAGGGDAEVYGYAGGVLVHFTVRGGAVRRWRQRACAPAQAGRWLAGTPVGWEDFAQRSADLAAWLDAQ